MRQYLKVVVFVGCVVMSVMSFSIIAAQAVTPAPVAEADLPVISAANAGQLKLLTSIPVHAIYGFSPDSKLWYDLYGDSNLYEWDIAAGKNAITVPVGFGYKVISPDSKTIYHLNADSVETWDTASGKMVGSAKLENAPQSATFRIVSPNGKFVGDMDTKGSGNVLVWDAVTGKNVFTVKYDIGSGASIMFSPDDQALLLLNSAGVVELVSMSDGSVLWTQHLDEGKLLFSPDGKTVAMLGSFGAVQFVDATNGKDGGSIPGDTTATSYSHGAAFSPDGKTLAVLMDTGDGLIYDLSGKTVATIKTNTDYIMNYGADPVFSPDGSLVTLQIDAGIQVADVTGAKVVGSLDIDPNLLTARGVSFSPDGKLLAVFSFDNTGSSSPAVVQLWGVGS